MALLAEGLLPASFRGVPFAVQADSISGGRRIANHKYPGRDTPWAEDMGRDQRGFSIRGFIVTGDVIFLGGPIQLQRLLLLAALEKKGPGTLIHPTLGVLNVSVPRFSMGQDLGAGRWSSVDLTFVDSGKKSFPSLLTSGSGILSSAVMSTVALALDFARVAAGVIGLVGGSKAASSVGNAAADQVSSAGQDATALQNLTAQLPGNYGRYGAGANSGFISSTASPYSSATTVDDLIASASVQRAAIETAAAAVAKAAANLSDAASFTVLTDALSILTDALLSACADPADAVRLLMGLIQNPPSIPSTGSSAGTAVVMAFKRAAATTLAKACAVYQPASYDDAFALLADVSALIDSVATEAADAGDDESFSALSALIVQIVEDLRSRGAVLAPIKTFTFSAPLPDVILAQRMYRDPSRAAELLAQCADTPHPLFMPMSFEALAA